MRHRKYALFLALAAITAACTSNTGSTPELTDNITASGLNPDNFKKEINGRQTSLYTLTNENDMEVCITDYGARIVSIMVPGRDGELHDVVLGADSIGGYTDAGNDLGGVCGRYAGYLDNDQVRIGNTTITVQHTKDSWMHRVFDAEQTSDTTLTLRLTSPAGENGFPSLVATQLDYTLHRNNSLTVDITAITDSITPVDIAQRVYFNLDGVSDSTLTNISNHTLKLDTEQYLVLDSLLHPTGDMLMSIWTPFDFARPKKLAPLLAGDFHQIKRARGLEAYFVLSSYGEYEQEALTLSSDKTGIALTLSTSFPGVEIYTANRFNGSLKGKNNAAFNRRTAIALMPHYYPDAPNRRGWGDNGIIRKGDVMRESVTYRFTVTD